MYIPQIALQTISRFLALISSCSYLRNPDAENPDGSVWSQSTAPSNYITKSYFRMLSRSSPFSIRMTGPRFLRFHKRSQSFVHDPNRTTLTAIETSSSDFMTRIAEVIGTHAVCMIAPSRQRITVNLSVTPTGIFAAGNEAVALQTKYAPQNAMPRATANRLKRSFRRDQA